MKKNRLGKKKREREKEKKTINSFRVLCKSLNETAARCSKYRPRYKPPARRLILSLQVTEY